MSVIECRGIAFFNAEPAAPAPEVLKEEPAAAAGEDAVVLPAGVPANAPRQADFIKLIPASSGEGKQFRQPARAALRRKLAEALLGPCGSDPGATRTADETREYYSAASFRRLKREHLDSWWGQIPEGFHFEVHDFKNPERQTLHSPVVDPFHRRIQDVSRQYPRRFVTTQRR